MPGWWQPLFDSCRTESIFLSAAWIQSWLQTFGARTKGTWVRWEAAEGVVVAGCLLAERVSWLRGIPFRTLFVNATGNPHEPLAEFNDVLCLPEHRDEVTRDLAQLIRASEWAQLMLCGYEANGVCARLLDALPAVHMDRQVMSTRHVDLDALQSNEFATTVRGKAGTRIRRNLREYRERLGSVMACPARDLEETRRFLTEMRTLHIERRLRLGQSTKMSSPAVLEFHLRLISLLWPDRVELLRVGSAERAIGYLYNFIVNGKVSVYQTGIAYDPSSKWSPGLLTHTVAIEHYRNRGMREYDLLAGAALYKRYLGTGSRDLNWTVVYRERAWIRLLLATRRLRNRVMAGGLTKKTNNVA